MRTFIENYLHFIKNCIRPPYKKLKTLKSGFIENSNFENNRDPCSPISHCLRLPVWLCERNSGGGIVAYIDQGLTQKSGAPRGCDQFWKEMTLFSV